MQNAVDLTSDEHEEGDETGIFASVVAKPVVMDFGEVPTVPDVALFLVR